MAVEDHLSSDDSGTTTGSRVWGPRVEQGPIIHSTADASSRWASDWTNSAQNTWMSKSEAIGLYGKLPQWQRDMFDGIAAASPSGMDSGRSVYERYVDSAAAYESQGLRRTPAELAMQDVNGGVVAFDPSGGDSSSGGGRGYSGPVSTVTNYNEADLRIMADSIGSEVLGRGVTDKEFRKVLAKVRAAESANPSVSGGAAAASMTNVSGLSQQGREDVMTRALLKQNGAEEFTLATKMMGLFNQALEGRPDA